MTQPVSIKAVMKQFAMMIGQTPVCPRCRETLSGFVFELGYATRDGLTRNTATALKKAMELDLCGNDRLGLAMQMTSILARVGGEEMVAEMFEQAGQLARERLRPSAEAARS